MEFERKEGTVEVIQPGCVVLRGAIPLRTQQAMLAACFEKGAPPEGHHTPAAGFFEAPKAEGGRLHLNQGNRGRIIHGIDEFARAGGGNLLAEECARYVGMGQAADRTLPSMTPTTVLVNFYNAKGAFKWHRDSEDPALVKAGTGKPIVSVSIGESCDFGIKNDYDGEDHTVVRLDSGDVLLFGGPSRMIVHSVLRIVPNSRPPSLRFPYEAGRLNITLRDVTGGVIDTSMFPAYRVAYDIEES
eukprot:TRINITY_DN32975_c0_g1_i1.p1 TRINITY_DN32975_c0_g1~~TRINITY_DN32975_c0_g1_i1.p1  ORF type:complete len:251 (+),score=79.12 TRINITY_DN32975_c0_g1_i1:22-753(+)